MRIERYFTIKPLRVLGCIPFHRRGKSSGPNFEFGSVNLNCFFSDIIFAWSVPHHSELAIPIDNALIAAHTRFMGVSRAKGLGNLGHRLAIAGHELRKSPQLRRDV